LPTGLQPRSFDLFCRVIDNYGDIGVCWRLARQLAQPPFSVNVRLWVDDLTRGHALFPAIRPDAAQQWHDAVEVRHWHGKDVPATPADVVIEAFACDPPAAFVHAMTPETLWINLEYLSAEPWVETCHGLPSPQPGGLRKWFFFPGFTAKTGGLLREPDLLARRAAWQADPQARWALLRALHLPDAALRTLQQRDARQILLFCYPHAPVAALLQGLMAQTSPTVVLACPGAIRDAHKTLVRGSQVHICDIPFVAQDRFDALLWGSDLNCVRGEDSVVRALWAARPLLWQLYPQAEDAHLEKLTAWLARAPYAAHVADLIRAWNATPSPDVNQVTGLLSASLAPAAYAQWHVAAQRWCQTLAQQDDLATALMAFCASKRQNR